MAAEGTPPTDPAAPVTPSDEPELREIRIAPPQHEFDAIAIPRRPVSMAPAHRLADMTFPSQFYANPRSRFTPISKEFPCVYLGGDRRTVVAEIFGDKVYQQRKAKQPTFILSTSLEDRKGFLRIPAIASSLNLCNLTDPDVCDALGIEGGTAWATDIRITQTWAERVARHPEHFDGLAYLSRHTFVACVVIWQRPGRRPPALPLLPDGPFVGCSEVADLVKRHHMRLLYVP